MASIQRHPGYEPDTLTRLSYSAIYSTRFFAYKDLSLLSMVAHKSNKAQSFGVFLGPSKAGT